MHGLGALVKRMVDLLAACIGLALLLLPFLAIALAIKLDDGGSVFFKQERVGMGGISLRVWKLRTMSVMLSNPTGPDVLHKEDARITRVGAVLRKLGLDELPQLFNVLVGDMSLVGPRPTLSYQVAAYDQFQRRRLEMKPGITSLAVVSGRNELSWEDRIKFDVWYIDHWSLCLDVSILFRTLWKVLVTHEGLYGADGVNDTFVKATNVPDREQEGKTT